MSPSPDRRAEMRQKMAELVMERFGTRIPDLEARFRDITPGDEWKVSGLLEEWRRLLAEFDAFEARVQIEMHSRAVDGMVDWAAVIDAVRAWTGEDE